MSYECDECKNEHTSDCDICSNNYDCMFERKKITMRIIPVMIKYRCMSCVYGHTCIKELPVGLDRPTKCNYGAHVEVLWHRVVLGVEVD